jgi:hypothetical protein
MVNEAFPNALMRQILPDHFCRPGNKRQIMPGTRFF